MNDYDFHFMISALKYACMKNIFQFLFSWQTYLLIWKVATSFLLLVSPTNGRQVTTYTEISIFEPLNVSESFCVLFGQTVFSEDCYHGYNQPTWDLLVQN